jgi:DNA topoisomerase-3
MGRAFAAVVKLNAEQQPEFDFGQTDDAEETVDFSGQESLGPCPKCSARVFEHGMSYVCEKAVGAGKSCDFRSGKIILQQEISRDEMHKLLAEGRTSLLKGFVSNKTRRKFSAFLVRDPASGKVGFEFEPRAAKPATKPRTTAAAAPKTTSVEKVSADETATKSATTKKATAPAAKRPRKK